MEAPENRGVFNVIVELRNRVTSGMKNLKCLKNLKNLKKSGNFTSSQEKLSEKPENLKKSGFFIFSQEKVSIFLAICYQI